jgi:hypothetical protein
MKSTQAQGLQIGLYACEAEHALHLVENFKLLLDNRDTAPLVLECDVVRDPQALLHRS